MNLRRLCDNKLFELIFFIAIPVISGAVCLIIGRSLISRDWQLVYREPSYKPPEWAVVLIWLAGALVLSGFILLTIWRARNSSFRIVPILYPLVLYGFQHVLTMIYLLFYMGLTSPLVAALINLAHCIVVLACIMLLWKWNFRKSSLLFILYWLWLLYCAVFTWGAFHKFLHTPSSALMHHAGNGTATNTTVVVDDGVVSYITAAPENFTTESTTSMPTSTSVPVVIVPVVNTTVFNSSALATLSPNETTTTTTAIPPLIKVTSDRGNGVGRVIEVTPPIRVGQSTARPTNITINGTATEIQSGNIHVVVPDEHENMTTSITPSSVETHTTR